LEDESRTEYEALWDGLKQDFQPHGMAESVLVEHLSVVLWRKRRFLEVERAEISKRDFLMGDFSVTEEAQKLDYATTVKPYNGDSSEGNHLPVIKEAINLLDKIRLGLAERDLRNVQPKIMKMFFPPQDHPKDDDRLRRAFYEVLRLTMEFTKEMHSSEVSAGYETTCEAIEAEIARLTGLYNRTAKFEALKAIHNLEVSRIPSMEVSDRLLRYEAHLSREFDKTLSQLERLQRIRKGQQVLPTIKLDLSS